MDQAKSFPTRRGVLQGLGAAAFLLTPVSGRLAEGQKAAGGPKVLIFTKHLQFIHDYDRLAETAVGLGYDGLDLAVRKGGHVLPENVERDLPRAVESARKAGLSVEMITTGIQRADDPATEPILRTASSLGIRLYRIGGWSYDLEKPLQAQMDAIQAQLRGIAELNARFNLCAAYQNHSGARDVGASIWDTWDMIKDLNPETIGLNYDLGHATIEGGYTWETRYRLTAPRVRIITLKDFRWTRDEKKERWKAEFVPMGEGMIQALPFLNLLKADGFSGPMTIHFEYDPRDSNGKETPEALLSAMKRDRAVVRDWLAQAGWE